MLKTIEKRQAELCHRQGNLTEAKRLYELHLANHSDDHETCHALGILLASNKQFQSALAHIEKAIALNANQATYYNSLGNVLRHLSELEKAAKAYQKAIKIQPDYAIAYNNLGAVYCQQKKLISSQQAYEKALALKENYADAHCNLGILLIELQEDDAAIIHLKRALELNPHLLNALNQLGDYYLRHEKYSEARDIFLKCVDKMPENTELNHRLGVAYFKLHDVKNAKLQFEKVLMLDYKHPEINQYYANTLLEIGDHEKAITYFFRQLERMPLFETYYNLGVLFMMKDRLQDALLYFNKAEQMEPLSIATQLNLGNIYLKNNKIIDAIAYYENANNLKPNDPEIQHILSALQQQKIPDHAPAEYITHLFDQYAPYYDRHLMEALEYDAPQKMFQAVQLEYLYLPEKQWKIVDLGCGTGLCGTLFKPFARKLIGVDLSKNMLAVARQKQIYDELIADDVTQALPQFSKCDLILAADVFTYIGDLELTFKNAANALISNGLFIFTVEKTYEKPFLLQTSIRYAHSKEYLESLIAAHAFDVMQFDNIVLRKQKNEPVEGYLVFLKKR